MLKALKRMSDQLLTRILPDVTAGACVPESGRICPFICKCPDFINGHIYVYSCHGSCVRTSTRCNCS